MELNKYQKFGKIYTIGHPDSEKYYIGSSAQQYLSKYFQSTKRKYKSGRLTKSVKQIFAFGVDECYIELLENFKCNDRCELERREGELIRLYKNDVVNKNVTVRTKEAKKEYMIEYYDTNKEVLKQYIKEYQQANKEDIKERMKMKYTCECGSELTKSAKLRHDKSQKHCKYFQSKLNL